MTKTATYIKKDCTSMEVIVRLRTCAVLFYDLCVLSISLNSNYTMPCAIIAFATLRNPVTLAPRT